MKKINEGFTIVEIIIGSLIFSIILAAIFTVLATAKTSWSSAGSQVYVQQEARKAMNIITKELRQARLSFISGLPADGSNYNSITFQIPESISETGTVWSSDIQYSMGGSNNTQIIRTQNTTQKIMANNISDFRLSRSPSTPEIIVVSVTSQKNTFSGFSSIQSSITLNSEVKVRNE